MVSFFKGMGYINGVVPSNAVLKKQNEAVHRDMFGGGCRLEGAYDDHFW